MSSTNNDSEDDDPRVHSSGMSSSSQPSRRYELSKSELRKNNKPIMEKKRRARINQCLNELKTLILDALKKDPARHTKLEKADILEMTVRHLQSLHRSSGNNRSMGAAGVGAGLSVEPSSSSAALTAAVVQKFQTGYQECAGEVNRFVGRLDGVDVDIKKRLMSHLDACVAKMRYVAAAAAGNAPPPNMNDYTLHHQLDSPSITAGSSALEPSTALVPGGPLLPLLRVGVQPSVPLKSSVDHHLRASAFTAVCGSSPSNVERPTFVYCDEPADVSSTSSWAEDAAAAAITVCKNPPLDFSMKKSVTACVSQNKKPLGDISVNVPTLTATTASSSSHKTNNAMTASSGDNGPTGPAQRLSVAAVAAEPCNDPGPDPNMWRPW